MMETKVAEARRADPDEPRRPQTLAWLASALTVSTIAASLALPRGDDRCLRAGGVSALILAGLFVFAPFLLLRKHGQTQGGETYMETHAAVDQGLYSITRHPQYLGYMLLNCGFALLCQHWAALLLAAVGVTLFYCQAVQEEKYCLDQLGEPYEQYLRRVPRFNIMLGIVRLLWRSYGVQS
jgi:protein-S-isoprenylcysteine O-methyltransferase Ste14